MQRRLFGTDEAAPPPLALQRGELMHIRCDEREIGHGVAFVFGSH